MGDSSGIRNAKRSWPKFWLLISAFLWLLAWEMVVWFVPVQPRAVIRIPNNDGLDPEIYENLAGFSPDGKIVVTTVERIARLTGQFHLWDAATGQDLGVVGNEGTKLLPNVVYCAQRSLLAERGFSEFFDAASEPSRTYILYDLIAGKEISPVRVELTEENDSHLCFAPDGQTLALWTNTPDKGDLKLIDVQTGQVRGHLQGVKYANSGGLAFSRDSRVLAITETKPSPDDNTPDDQRLIVLDTKTGESRRILLNYGEEALRLNVSPDGTKLAAECRLRSTDVDDIRQSEVRLWDLANGKQIASFPAPGFPGFLGFIKDGKGLALWHQDQLGFRDSITGKEYAVGEKCPSFTAFMGYVTPSPIPIPSTHLLAVQISHHSKPSRFLQWCATYLGIKGLGDERNDEELAFLDTRTGKAVAAIIRPTIDVVKVFPGGTKLAFTRLENDDLFLEIWDIPPRKPLRWVLGLLAIPSLMTLITLWRSRFPFVWPPRPSLTPELGR